ncbi:hypothetical protein BCR32DRAFT_251129 [Anaeromyces robustus]|uniref:Uncharacterized protein n=1 Tax=Anaeromyces robustus TaxID=1754192 RepID=A0A1Y1VTP7_9FUNG|nr:hypothetical protein BCR32DRAFT_251129 [Anaeromyces robustus]|eukprot:ORX64385.1 hypothetical protein BCR32DRAFT_251129 [Anaeromyces robustus]
MKGSTKFLISLIASFTLINAIPVNTNTRSLFFIDKKCEDALNKTILHGFKLNDSECFYGSNEIIPRSEEAENLCNHYYSEKCQELFNIKISELSECQNSNSDSNSLYLKTMDYQLELANLKMKVLCNRDENNKTCPFNKQDIIDALNYEEVDNEIEADNLEFNHYLYNTAKEQLEKLVQKNCESKKCTDTFIKVTEDMNQLNESYNNFLKDYLKAKPIETTSETLEEDVREELKDLLNNIIYKSYKNQKEYRHDHHKVQQLIKIIRSGEVSSEYERPVDVYESFTEELLEVIIEYFKSGKCTSKIF